MNKVFIFSSLLFISFGAFAMEEDDFIDSSGQKKFSLQNRILFDNIFDDQYDAAEDKNEYKNTEARFDLVSKLVYDKKFFLYFNYRIQEDPWQTSEISRRATTSQGGGDKSYENHFGITRELYLGFEDEKMKFFAGKFRPEFGRAWLIGRGIWTQEPAIDYMQLERLGAGGAIKGGNAKTIGAYKLQYSAYTHDIKNLDNSQITTRDASYKSSGNAGDARGFGSYTVNLDVNFDFGEKEKLFYRFAYSNLDVDSNQAVSRLSANKIENQKGYSAAMIYKYPFAKNFNLDSLIEYVEVNNFNGDADIKNKYFNANAIANFYDNWNVTAAFARKQNIHQGQNGFDEYFCEISAGYTFKNKLLFDQLQIQIGHKALRVNYKNSLDEASSYGALIRYIKFF